MKQLYSNKDVLKKFFLNEVEMKIFFMHMKGDRICCQQTYVRNVIGNSPGEGKRYQVETWIYTKEWRVPESQYVDKYKRPFFSFEKNFKGNWLFKAKIIITMYVGFITSIELKSKITIAQRKGRGWKDMPINWTT